MKSYSEIGSLILLSSALLYPGFAVAQNTNSAVDKATDANVGDHVQVHQIFINLQQAVATHDSGALRP